MTIGENIRKLRLKHKLSIRALARKIPTDPSTIYTIEEKGREPGVYLADKIAKALKTTIDKII